LVDLVGEVDEFFGFTEIKNVSALVIEGLGTVPAPVMFDAAVPSPDPLTPSCSIEYECYEGMYIEVLNGTVTGPNQRFSTDLIAEVHITAAPMRTFREPGILFPGLTGLPIWDGNPEVFELDPDKLGLPNAIIPAGSSFSAKGALGYEFGGYELWPNELTYAPAEIPRAVRERVAGEFTVGSLNMFRFFDDIDDPPSENAQGQERDDFVVSTAEYQRRKAKLADYILSVLDAPDVLAVQEVEKIEVLEDLAVEIAAMSDPTVIYTPILVEGNDIGTIDVGFMVRDTVTVESFEQLGYHETYFNPVDMTEDILHGGSGTRSTSAAETLRASGVCCREGAGSAGGEPRNPLCRHR
jgi:predicted extracellular nuclease